MPAKRATHTMSDPIMQHQTPADRERLAVEIATTKESLKGLGDDVEGMGRRMGALENEMRKGFSTVSTDLARITGELSRELNRVSTPKGIQWPMVTVWITITLVLATWATNFFNKDFAAVAKEIAGMNERMDMIKDRVYAISLDTAAKSGAAAVEQKWIEKERDEIRKEIDKIRQASKLPGP